MASFSTPTCHRYILFLIYVALRLTTQVEVDSLEIKIDSNLLSGMDGPLCSGCTAYFTLWFNDTIYQYEITEPSPGATYTAYKGSELQMMTLMSDSGCSTHFESTLMITNQNADSFCMEYVKIATSSGDWYQVDAFLNSQGVQSEICVDNNWMNPPPHQIVYFDVTQPNKTISNAEWSDGTEVSTVLMACAPTGNPTQPIITPTTHPTSVPTTQPTIYPTKIPTTDPTTYNPTNAPTTDPTIEPTIYPTTIPTNYATNDNRKVDDLWVILGAVTVVTVCNCVILMLCGCIGIRKKSKKKAAAQIAMTQKEIVTVKQSVVVVHHEIEMKRNIEGEDDSKSNESMYDMEGVQQPKQTKATTKTVN